MFTPLGTFHVCAPPVYENACLLDPEPLIVYRLPDPSAYTGLNPVPARLVTRTKPDVAVPVLLPGVSMMLPPALLPVPPFWAASMILPPPLPLAVPPSTSSIPAGLLVPMPTLAPSLYMLLEFTIHADPFQ
jgi:hypothetical protein